LPFHSSFFAKVRKNKETTTECLYKIRKKQNFHLNKVK